MKALVFILLGGLMIGTTLPGIAGQNVFVFIGTYTGSKSKGIYRSSFDAVTGKLTAPELAIETENPSFLTMHPNGRYLYAVGETSDFGNKGSGSVSAYALDSASGKLSFLARQSSGGGGPCHLSIDHSGKWLFVANYGAGSIAILPIRPDGGLGEATAVLQHKGAGANPQRQEGPHAHFITADPGNRFVLACDLGLDKVLIYRLDPQAGSLTVNDPPDLSVAPASGPRHLAFHPSGRFVYLINELNSTLSALRYDPQRGELREVQTVSTLPPDFKGNNSCAEVQVHSSGRFVYGSNRGDNSLAVFMAEPKTGRLTLVQHQSTQGKTPRYFGIDPTGQWLLACNQDSDSIAIFRIDPRTGRLTATGQTVSVGAPVCLAWVSP